MLFYLNMIETPSERSQFEEIYMEYRQLMYRVAYKILRNQSDAEDAVHQAFLSIIENFSKYSKNLKPKCPKTASFCVITVERKSIDIIRARTKESIEEYDEDGIERAPTIAESPYENYADFTKEDSLTEAVSMLPTRYRELIQLKYYHGYSVKEIAGMLGKRTDTVQRALTRAKHDLEKNLEELRKEK